MTLLRRAADLGLAVVLGVVAAVPSVFLHRLKWPLPLVAVTAVALLLALPSGAPRVAYALGWGATVVAFALPRADGGLVVPSGTAALLLLGLAALLLVVSLVTLPTGRARHPGRAGRRT